MSIEQPSPPADEKLRLECEKLKAEIEATRRPILRTPSFYATISPVVLAVLGLLWSWWSGWFDVQRTRVNNEKIMVEAQTERLKTERITLERQAAEQRTYIAGIEGELTKLRLDRSSLSNQITRLEKERDEMRAAKTFFESEAKRLAGSETNTLRLFSELQAAQAERQNLGEQIRVLQTTNATLLTYCSNQTQMIIRAHHLAGSVSTTIVSDKMLRAKLNPLFNESLDVMLDAIRYLPWWKVEPDPAGDKLRPKTYDEYLQDATNRLQKQINVLKN